MATTPPALLDTREAARRLGLAARSLEALRQRGGGPPFVRLGRRAVRYRAQDLEDYVAERLRRSTSDPGAES